MTQRSRSRKLGALMGVDFIDFLKSINNSVSWPTDETSGDVLIASNPAVAEGRERAVNGDFSAWTGDNPDGWSVIEVGDATSNVTQNPAGQCQIISDGPLAQMIQVIFSLGATYRIEVVTSAVASGSITVLDGAVSFSHVISTATTTTFDITAVHPSLIIKRTAGASCNVTIDNVSIKQINIAASSSFATPSDNPFDADVTGAAITATSGVSFPYARSYDGLNDYTDIYSAELNSFFNPAQGTLIAFAKVANAGVWTDTLDRNIVRIGTDGSNLIDLRKSSTNNQISVFFRRGTDFDVINTPYSSINWFMIAIKWNTTNAYVYINNNLVGTIGNTGTWVGNLVSTGCVIGALNTTPTSIWNGDIASVLLSQDILSDTQILQIAQKAGVA